MIVMIAGIQTKATCKNVGTPIKPANVARSCFENAERRRRDFSLAAAVFIKGNIVEFTR